MAAGLVQSLVITPVDLLKIRQQLQTAVPGSAAYVGPLQLLRHVCRAEGFTGEQRRPYTSVHMQPEVSGTRSIVRTSTEMWMSSLSLSVPPKAELDMIS